MATVLPSPGGGGGVVGSGTAAVPSPSGAGFEASTEEEAPPSASSLPASVSGSFSLVEEGVGLVSTGAKIRSRKKSCETNVVCVCRGVGNNEKKTRQNA